MQKKNNDIIGLVIKDGEKTNLYKLCKKYGIPVLYESLFENENNYYLWGIFKHGIALIGTQIMSKLNFIFHNLEEFESHLKKNGKLQIIYIR